MSRSNDQSMPTPILLITSPTVMHTHPLKASQNADISEGAEHVVHDT